MIIELPLAHYQQSDMRQAYVLAEILREIEPRWATLFPGLPAIWDEGWFSACLMHVLHYKGWLTMTAEQKKAAIELGRLVKIRTANVIGVWKKWDSATDAVQVVDAEGEIHAAHINDLLRIEPHAGDFVKRVGEHDTAKGRFQPAPNPWQGVIVYAKREDGKRSKTEITLPILEIVAVLEDDTAPSISDLPTEPDLDLPAADAPRPTAELRVEELRGRLEKLLSENKLPYQAITTTTRLHEGKPQIAFMLEHAVGMTALSFLFLAAHGFRVADGTATSKTIVFDGNPHAADDEQPATAAPSMDDEPIAENAITPDDTPDFAATFSPPPVPPPLEFPDELLEAGEEQPVPDFMDQESSTVKPYLSDAEELDLLRAQFEAANFELRKARRCIANLEKRNEELALTADDRRSPQVEIKTLFHQIACNMATQYSVADEELQDALNDGWTVENITVTASTMNVAVEWASEPNPTVFHYRVVTLRRQLRIDPTPGDRLSAFQNFVDELPIDDDDRAVSDIPLDDVIVQPSAPLNLGPIAATIAEHGLEDVTAMFDQEAADAGRAAAAAFRAKHPARHFSPFPTALPAGQPTAEVQS